MEPLWSKVAGVTRLTSQNRGNTMTNVTKKELSEKFTGPITDQERWLTQQQAAAVLNTSITTLWRMRRSADGLPYYRLGGQIRYKLSEVEEYIRRQ